MRPCTPARPYPRTSQRPARRLPNAPIDPAGRSRRLSRFPTALRLAHLGRSQLRRWRSIHHPVSNMATSLDRVRRLRGLRSILAGVRRAALRASCDAASWDGRLGVLGRATGCRATARWRAGREGEDERARGPDAVRRSSVSCDTWLAVLGRPSWDANAGRPRTLPVMGHLVVRRETAATPYRTRRECCTSAPR
jgi:hypothetical protein